MAKLKPIPCATCAGAGLVWARSFALPKGFNIFCGSALNRSDDRKHVELICPDCDGAGNHIEYAKRQKDSP